MPDPARTVTFGDLEQGLWGAAWFPGLDPSGVLVLGTGERSEAAEVALELVDEEWHLQGQGVEVVVAPAGPAVQLADQPGSEQLCTVSVTLGPDPQLQVPGRRGEHPLTLGPDRVDSVREVSAWFEGGEAVAVLALRARKQRGHDQDATTAALIDEQSPPIVDPRLSTTYAASGRPTRMTLELWTDDPEQHPRRVAGEAAGPWAEAAGAGWTMSAQLLRCHSRGRDGTGVYVLARPA